MIIILFAFGAFFSVGLFLILAEVLRIPTIRTVQAMSSAGKLEYKAAKSIETILMDGAVLLSRHLPMNPHKKARLTATLRAAGMDTSPEVYTSYAIVKAGTLLIGVIPCIAIFPLASIMVLMAALMTYFKEIETADKKLRAKREVIEDELSRFASTVEQELKTAGMYCRFWKISKRTQGRNLQKNWILCAPTCVPRVMRRR